MLFSQRVIVDYLLPSHVIIVECMDGLIDGPHCEARQCAEDGLALMGRIQIWMHSRGGEGEGAATADPFVEACRRAEGELRSFRLADRQPLMDRLQRARRVRVLGLPPGTNSAAHKVKAYLEAALAPHTPHHCSAVLSARAAVGGGWGQPFAIVVELATAAAAAAALALDAHGPNDEPLDIQPTSDAPRLLPELSASVQAALARAVVAGALSPNDVNNADALEALRLVDQSAAVETLGALTTEGASGCIAGRVSTPLKR